MQVKTGGAWVDASESACSFPFETRFVAEARLSKSLSDGALSIFSASVTDPIRLLCAGDVIVRIVCKETGTVTNSCRFTLLEPLAHSAGSQGE